jgi:predicted nucleotidyltransferase
VATSSLDVAATVRAALLSHAHVRDVRLVGSRAEGQANRLSDWDFVVEVDAFRAVAADLPAVVSVLDPIAQQWDRLSDEYCYMVMVHGPTKIDLIFHEACEPQPPWEVTPRTLVAIDQHFWDWALWLASKHLAGRDTIVVSELHKMSVHLLKPIGVRFEPRTLDDAVANYIVARRRLESDFGVVVPRELESEVMRALSGYAAPVR